MSAALFTIVEDQRVGEHRYVRVAPVNPTTLVSELAPRIRTRYIDEEAARERLLRAASELTEFDGTSLALDEAEVEEALDSERSAVLPAAWTGDRPRQLDVQRSEFAEIIAAEVLTQLFGTRIPASRISHKEIPDQQARGADIMGLEGLDYEASIVVLCEIKGSEESVSPPGVVAGMEKKLRRLTTDRRAMAQELIWLRDHSNDEHAHLCAHLCASFLLKKERFSIVLAPILVRSRSTAQPGDPGNFLSAPESFDHPIRWVTVLVDGKLSEVATEAYRLATGAAA